MKVRDFLSIADGDVEIFDPCGNMIVRINTWYSASDVLSTKLLERQISSVESLDLNVITVYLKEKEENTND